MDLATFAGKAYAESWSAQRITINKTVDVNMLPWDDRRQVLEAAAMHLVTSATTIKHFYQDHPEVPVIPNVLVHGPVAMGTGEAGWGDLIDRIPLAEHRQFLIRQAAWFNTQRVAADYVRRAVEADDVEDIDMAPFIQAIIDATANDDVEELARLDKLLNEGGSDERVCFMAVGGMRRFAMEASGRALQGGSAGVAEYVANMPGVGAEVMNAELRVYTEDDREGKLRELRPLFQQAPHVLALAVAQFPEYADVLLRP